MRSTALPAARFAALASLCVFCAACGPSAEEKAEADRVSRAIDELRRAENPSKRQRWKALAATPCRLDDVCALRRACAAAYELHVRALEEIAAVRRSTRRTDPVPGAKAQRLLDGAGERLAAAKTATRRCVDLQAKLKRKYEID